MEAGSRKRAPEAFSYSICFFYACHLDTPKIQELTGHQQIQALRNCAGQSIAASQNVPSSDALYCY